jgi:cytochrome c oxidase assembly factor CtaG
LAAFVVFLAGLVYVRGWRRLQRFRFDQTGLRSPASTRSLVFFLAGLALLAGALISPLGYLSTQYFSARIVQHMLIVASIPSLLMLPNPVPALIHGLPARWRQASLAAIQPSLPPVAGNPGTIRRFVHWATAPGVTLLAFLSICWFWYDPAIHQATLEYTWVHAIELTSLFAVGLLNWWHITGAWPQLHGHMHPVVRILYAFVSIWPVKLIGLILLFITEPFYQYPATFQFSGLDINDYTFGAMIAWIVSGLAYAVAVVVLFREWLGEEETKPTLPESAWATDEAMIAPGIKR